MKGILNFLCSDRYVRRSADLFSSLTAPPFSQFAPVLKTNRNLISPRGRLYYRRPNISGKSREKPNLFLLSLEFPRILHFLAFT